MPATIIRSPPLVSDYVPLSEYQSQTPETFHGGKPVLHYHATGVLARVYRSQCDSLAFFSNPSPLSFPEPSVDNPDEKCEQVVDLFVNSQNFTIYSPQAESGLSLPYPTITLHAIKKVQNTAVEGQEFPSVYLQLELSDGGEDDETYDTVELTLLPGPKSGSDANEPQPEEVKVLFEAISECSNLNPDPAGEGEEDDEDEYDKIVFEGDVEADGEEIAGLPGVYASGGDLPPPMPGSSGWITAENVHEYFDEEGNWIGGEQQEEEGVSGELGEGAGRVRGRDEVEGETEVNGHGTEGEDSESKRVRTE